MDVGEPETIVTVRSTVNLQLFRDSETDPKHQFKVANHLGAVEPARTDFRVIRKRIAEPRSRIGHRVFPPSSATWSQRPAGATEETFLNAAGYPTSVPSIH